MATEPVAIWKPGQPFTRRWWRFAWRRPGGKSRTVRKRGLVWRPLIGRIWFGRQS